MATTPATPYVTPLESRLNRSVPPSPRQGVALDMGGNEGARSVSRSFFTKLFHPLLTTAIQSKQTYYITIARSLKVPEITVFYRDKPVSNVVLWISCFVGVDNFRGESCINFFIQNFSGLLECGWWLSKVTHGS